MRRILVAVTAALALAGVAGGSAVASNGQGNASQVCEYFYNPIAGNYLVLEYTFGQFNKGVEFPSKQYTTDTPPTSCDFQGIIPL